MDLNDYICSAVLTDKDCKLTSINILLYERQNFSDRWYGLYRLAHGCGIAECRLRCSDCGQPFQLQRGRRGQHRGRIGHPSGFRENRLPGLCRLGRRLRQISRHQGHHPFRRQQGGGRIGAEAVAVLPQQPGLADQPPRTDAQIRRGRHRLLLVVHRLWPARPLARDGRSPHQES